MALYTQDHVPKGEIYFEKVYNTVEILFSCLWTTAKKISAFILLGVFFLPIKATISYAFFTFAITAIVCKLVTKSIDCYNPSCLDTLKNEFFNIQRTYPYIPLISWIFIMLITPVSGFLGVTSGAMMGLYNGMSTESSSLILEEVDEEVDLNIPLPDYMM